MNIDKDKLYEILRSSNMEHLTKRILKSCEVNCSDCIYNKKTDNEFPCCDCSAIHQSLYFIPKPCEHTWSYYGTRNDGYRTCDTCNTKQKARWDE